MPEFADIRLPVRVRTRSSRCELQGVVDGRLVVKTTAAPIDGSANAEVARQLAQAFGVPPSRVNLHKGARSSNKVFLIKKPEIIPDFLAQM